MKAEQILLRGVQIVFEWCDVLPLYCTKMRKETVTNSIDVSSQYRTTPIFALLESLNSKTTFFAIIFEAVQKRFYEAANKSYFVEIRCGEKSGEVTEHLQGADRRISISNIHISV